MKNQTNEQNKFNVFKCSNCGSSDYTQVSNDIFQCNYCGSKLENDNTATDKFISFIDSTSKVKKNLWLVESLVSKEQFFKRALIYMSARHNSPEDVLNVKIDDVTMSYAYYFVIDAKFDKIESPEHLEIDLNTIPGVVENGIFSQMVDKVIVGTPEGTKEL